MPFAYFAPFDAHGGLLVWLFGNGIGTNIGASLVWGFAAGFVGYLAARKVKAAWVTLHAKLDAHHEAHGSHLHDIEDAIADLHQLVAGRRSRGR